MSDIDILFILLFADAAAKKVARANRPGMKTKAVPAPVASPPKKNKRGRCKDTTKTPDSLVDTPSSSDSGRG